MSRPTTRKHGTPTRNLIERNKQASPVGSSVEPYGGADGGAAAELPQKAASAGAPSCDQSAPRPHTKGERLLKLLQTGTGASLGEMVEATGWQAHTVRAAMTGLRKRGYEIERHTEGTTSMWSAKEKGK